MSDDFIKDLEKMVISPSAIPESTLTEEEQAVVRFPILFLIDVSRSTGQTDHPDIDKINTIMDDLLHRLHNPEPGSPLYDQKDAIDIAIMAYSNRVWPIIDWSTMSKAPTKLPEPLTTKATTNMGGALLYALLKCRARIQQNLTTHTECGVPHIFHITDGYPSDMTEGSERWNEIKSRILKLTDNGVTERRSGIVYHFITPQGVTDRGALRDGQKTDGREIMSRLSGPETVKTIADDASGFLELLEFIILVVSRLSNHYPPSEVLSGALAEYKGSLT